MYDNFAATVKRARADGAIYERENCAISRNDGRNDDRRTHAPRPKAEAKHGTGRGHIGQGTRTHRAGDAAHWDAARRPTAAIKKKRF